MSVKMTDLYHILVLGVNVVNSGCSLLITLVIFTSFNAT